MANTVWMNACGDDTQDLSSWPFQTIGGAVTFDTGFVAGKSIKISCSSSTTLRRAAIMADGGRRGTFRFKFDTLTSGSGVFFNVQNSAGTSIFPVNVNQATGKIQAIPAGGVAVLGTHILAVNTWYRISFAYVITSTTVWRLVVRVDGALDIDTSNTGTLTTITSDRFQIGNSTGFGTSAFVWFDDVFIDDGSDLGDPGNAIITHKRVFANGAINDATSQLGTGGSGYGSGHAPQVNEQPLATANAWQIPAPGSAISKTEEYTIEANNVGDLDISPAKFTIVDYMGWIHARGAGAQTGNIIINGVASNVALTASAARFEKVAGSTTYPSGNAAIGMNNNSLNAFVTMYECGILIAVISNVAQTATEAPTTAESAQGKVGFKATDAPTTAEAATDARFVPRSFSELLQADAEFTPNLITGLELWLAADSLGLSDGTAVANWPDLSPNGRNGVATGTPTFKTGIINGLPVVRFVTNQRFTGTGTPITSPQPNTIIFVANQTSVTTGPRPFDGDNATPTTRQYVMLSTSGVFQMYGGSVLIVGSGNKSGAFHIFQADFNGASSKGYVDGVQNITGNPGSAPMGQGGVWGQNTQSTWLNGDLAEILVYSSLLTLDQRNAVGGYFAKKYGLIVSGGTDPQPIRTILMPRPANDAPSTAESADHSELAVHPTADAPTTAESMGRIATLYRTTTD